MYNFIVRDLKQNFQTSQPEQKTALNDFYLVRTYRDDNPFTTLSDIEEEQAQAIMKKSYSHIDDDNIAMRKKVVPPPIKESRFSRCSARYNWMNIGGINHGKEAFQA